MKSKTWSSLSPALSRSRTARRMSRATSAAESSIDWFWQTTQRSAWPISRARASSAGSFSISDGSTASAGRREQRHEQQGERARLTACRP